ncbi:MAG: hypothetical protein VYC17_00120 [Nitrospinota bacterium]|nr:hypothetical protein [Nitrospinota bacterium]
MVKAVFRYILTYDTPEGGANIVEFGNEAEYKEFKEELTKQNIESRLINSRKMKELLYKKANYIDMRD